MPGKCALTLIAVSLPQGGNASNIKVKGKNWGDYFVYDDDDKVRDWVVFSKRILLGDHAGFNGTDIHAINIGNRSGNRNQQEYASAIGIGAGETDQKSNAIAIGSQAGENRQNLYAIAMGQNAGQTNQQNSAIAIGKNTAQTEQQNNAIAIGTNAAQKNQQNNAISIGTNAGQTGQKTYSIAIGTNTAQTNQGKYSIAIGTNAGRTGQAENSIMFSAVPNGISSKESGFYVKPIRAASYGSMLCYDPYNNEIHYEGSSRRYKYDIISLENLTSTVYQLQPREFKYKLSGQTDIGLIAEEVYEIDSSLAYLNQNNIPEGIRWNTITTYLLKEIKKLRNRILVLKEKKQLFSTRTTGFT